MYKVFIPFKFKQNINEQLSKLTLGVFEMMYINQYCMYNKYYFKRS